jgi:hypothetical protein
VAAGVLGTQFDVDLVVISELQNQQNVRQAIGLAAIAGAA